MISTHELALLVAVALPVAAIAAMNAWMLLSGERDTLLLPGISSFPAVEVQPARASIQSHGEAAGAAANDSEEKIAA